MTATYTSVECRECGNPAVIFHNVYIDWECRKAWDADEYEDQCRTWALQYAEAQRDDINDGHWQEGWH